MSIKIYISKAVTITCIALLFFSFKSSYWELDKESRETVHASIAKLFNNEGYSINDVDDTFYSILENDSIMGYLVVTDAPSKFHMFDYYIIFNNKAEVLKVEILHYRENYGAEICSKMWLKQFVGVDTKDFKAYNNSIDGISGATISVNSLKKDLLKTCKELSLKL